MKNKAKNKYQVVGDGADFSDTFFGTVRAAEDYAKELLQDGSNETAEIFELVPVKKFKMAAVEVKD